MSALAPRRGRRIKPLEERHEAQLSVYFTADEFDALARMAYQAGDQMAVFVRDRLLESLGIAQCSKSPEV